MKTLITAGLLGLSALSSITHAADSRNYVTTKPYGESCLHVFNDDGSYVLCDSMALTPEQSAMLKTAIRERDIADKRRLIAGSPNTPKFNLCVEKYDADYVFVMQVCMERLRDELNAEFGSFWNQDQKKAVYEEALGRIRLMAAIKEKQDRDAAEDKVARRTYMTPTQRRIDELEEKLNAPCRYYDRNSISRPCD